MTGAPGQYQRQPVSGRDLTEAPVPCAGYRGDRWREALCTQPVWQGEEHAMETSGGNGGAR